MIATAYSELTRVLPWSLRALGYSFPVADRAAHIIASAAAFDASVLDGMTRLTHRPAGQTSTRIQSNGNCRIDAMKQSILEVGPALIDFMATTVHPCGSSCAEIENVIQLEILPAVLLGGLDYGLHSIAVTKLDNRHVWLGTAKLNGTRYLLEGSDPKDLSAILGSANPRISEEASRVFKGMQDSACVLYGFRDPINVTVDLPTVGIVDADMALDRAFKTGIPVEIDTLKAIYELEKLTWAPTSERSRMQAGFVAPPVGGAS